MKANADSKQRLLVQIAVAGSVLLAVLSTIGADVYAADVFDSRPFVEDPRFWSHNLLLMVPFVLVALMCASAARLYRLWAPVTYVVCEAYLSYLAGLAYYRAHQAFAQELWTAYALSMGLLIFRMLPSVILALLLWTTYRRRLKQARESRWWR
jgi:hypothetical protein